MIDLDSLCFFGVWYSISSAVRNKRYIKWHTLRVGDLKVPVSEAIDYVYLLIICISEAWRLGKGDKVMNANALLQGREREYLSRMLDGSASPVNECAINGILLDYRREFERRGGFASIDPWP
jgi:hypothetical protein